MKNKGESLEAYYGGHPKLMRLYQRERTLLEITELFAKSMKEKGISQISLAKKLGLTAGRISQIVHGRGNLTLKTISDVFWALDMSICAISIPITMGYPKVIVVPNDSQQSTPAMGLGPMTNHEMFEKSFQRPKNFFSLPATTQWAIDKNLGILDWDGSEPLSKEDEKRFHDHYKCKKVVKKEKET